MADKSTVPDIMQRLTALVEALAGRIKQAAAGTGLPEGHAEKAQALGEKAEAIRQKLPESSGDSVWDGIVHEVERDVHALEQDFDHWVRYLDEHYEAQSK